MNQQKFKKVYINKSLVDGIGVFALADIKKGEIIAIMKGKLVKYLVSDKKTSSKGPNWIGIGKNKWINPKPPFSNINHSCEPNAGIKGSKTMIALRNIDKDEEVLIDYSTTEEDKLWNLDKVCRCGSKNCRKEIKSIHFLPEKTFKKYLPYIPSFFKKKYIKSHFIRN